MSGIARKCCFLPQRASRELSRRRPFLNYNSFHSHVFSHTYLPASFGTSQQPYSRSFHSSRTHNSKRDHYDVLGVDKGVSKADLKKAYYKLAKKYHPDANPDDKDTAQKKFAEISNAYETLADDSRRQAYDQFGHDADQMGGDGGFSGFTNAEDLFAQMFGGRGGGGGNPFGDIFGGGGGGRGGQKRPQRGSDLQVGVQLDFMEAVEGVTKNVSVRCLDTCDDCTGSGVEKGTKPKVCSQCNGAGMQRQSQGPFVFEMPCNQCNGEGQSQTSCRSCRGQGLVRDTREVAVKIPAGCDNDTRLRLVNQGNAGTLGGPRGHLWVELKVKTHEFFKREGADIHLDVPIPVSTAILGGTVAVPTLNGEVNLKIPAGTQPNEKQAMRGKGIKELKRSGKGNLYVHFKVHIPKNVSGKGKELMEQFAEEEAASVTKANQGVFSKIKGYFKEKCQEKNVG